MSEQLQQQISPLLRTDPGNSTNLTPLQMPVETTSETC